MFMSFKLFLGVLQNLIKFWVLSTPGARWYGAFCVKSFRRRRESNPHIVVLSRTQVMTGIDHLEMSIPSRL